MSGKVLGVRTLRQQVEHEISMLAGALGAVAFDLDGIDAGKVTAGGLAILQRCSRDVTVIGARVEAVKLSAPTPAEQAILDDAERCGTGNNATCGECAKPAPPAAELVAAGWTDDPSGWICKECSAPKVARGLAAASKAGAS